MPATVEHRTDWRQFHPDDVVRVDGIRGRRFRFRRAIVIDGEADYFELVDERGGRRSIDAQRCHRLAKASAAAKEASR